MPRIARTLGLAFGLLGGLAASQGPEYVQQYRQRLGGAIDELRRVVERFERDAQATGQTREGAIGQLDENRDALVRRQGDAMRANIERLDRLERQGQAFQTAGPFRRLVVLAHDADPEIARAAYLDYEPAVPTTVEGYTMAGAGFLAGWSISRLIGRCLRPLFFRRRRPRAG
jgi:DUF2937 family protein